LNVLNESEFPEILKLQQDVHFAMKPIESKRTPVDRVSS